MLGKEPAVILGAIQAILALGLSFGLKLEPTQIGAITAAAAAILALVVRQQVIPVKNQSANQQQTG